MAVGSGADVSVGAKDGTGVNTAAVNVNCDTTVLAAEVRTTETLGVGSGVDEDPHAASRISVTNAVKISFSFIEPLFCS